MEINENCEIGIVVGTLFVEDVDRGQNLIFFLFDISNFVVEGDQVKVIGNIDFEQIVFLIFKVIVIDDGYLFRFVSVQFCQYKGVIIMYLNLMIDIGRLIIKESS